MVINSEDWFSGSWNKRCFFILIILFTSSRNAGSATIFPNMYYYPVISENGICVGRIWVAMSFVCVTFLSESKDVGIYM